jgi:hypothetical protein
MDSKKIITGGITGGAILFILFFSFNMIMNMVIPYDITKFGGMRAMNDPVMLLFFLYPFVVAFAQAVLFDSVQDSLKGTPVQKGLRFSGLLFVIMTIPSLFVMATSMDWPVDFYANTILWEVVGFLIIGALFTRIWKV